MMNLKSILMGTVAALGVQPAAAQDSRREDTALAERIDHFVCIEEDPGSGKLRAIFRVAESNAANMPDIGYAGPGGTVISDVTYASNFDQVMYMIRSEYLSSHPDDIQILQKEQFEAAIKAFEGGDLSCDYSA